MWQTTVGCHHRHGFTVAVVGAAAEDPRGGGVTGLAGFMAEGFFTPLFLLPAAWHLRAQLKKWDVNDPASALATFKSNRDFGLLVLAGV